MTNDLIVLKGVVRGKTIELERNPGLPEGQRVVVELRSEDDADAERQAEETLQTIYQMRHTGRSICQP